MFSQKHGKNTDNPKIYLKEMQTGGSNVFQFPLVSRKPPDQTGCCKTFHSSLWGTPKEHSTQPIG